MTSAVILSDGGAQVAGLEQSLLAAGAAPVRHLGWRRPVGPAIAASKPALIFIDEPACSPLPLAVVREARSSAPEAIVVVRAAAPGPNWLVDAQLSGATTVLPAATRGDELASAVAALLHTHEAAPLRWAA